MPNREAWQAIAARQPSIPLGLRRRISFRDAVWGARARLRQERERAFQPNYARDDQHPTDRRNPDAEVPLTPAMERELDRLGAKLWRDLRKRGCPCCEAGLGWYPAEQAH